MVATGQYSSQQARENSCHGLIHKIANISSGEFPDIDICSLGRVVKKLKNEPPSFVVERRHRIQLYSNE